MQVSSNFDSDSVALMGCVCDEAWREVQATVAFPTPMDSDHFLRELAIRVMAAVAAGERDPGRLKAIALDGIDG